MNGCSLLLVNNLFSKMMRSWKIKLFEYIYLRVEIEWLYGIMNPFFFLQFYYKFVRIYFSFNWNTGWIISLVAKNLKYMKNSKISGCKIKFYLLNSRTSFALSPFPSISLTNNLITKDWTNHTRACAIFDQYNTGLKKSCTRESKTQEMNGIFFSPFLSILFFSKIYPTRVILAQEWLNF